MINVSKLLEETIINSSLHSLLAFYTIYITYIYIAKQDLLELVATLLASTAAFGFPRDPWHCQPHKAYHFSISLLRFGFLPADNLTDASGFKRILHSLVWIFVPTLRTLIVLCTFLLQLRISLRIKFPTFSTRTAITRT